MTIEEFYSVAGGDYGEVIARLGNRALVVKILAMFTNDKNLSLLETAIKERDYDTAFRAAHTLKGIFLNLGFKSLASQSAQLTEALRTRGDWNEIQAAFEPMKVDCIKLKTSIDNLLESEKTGKEGDMNG